MDVAGLRAKIRDIKDFPTEGILFKDITTLLKDGPAWRYAVGRPRPLPESSDQARPASCSFAKNSPISRQTSSPPESPCQRIRMSPVR